MAKTEVQFRLLLGREHSENTQARLIVAEKLTIVWQWQLNTACH